MNTLYRHVTQLPIINRKLSKFLLNVGHNWSADFNVYSKTVQFSRNLCFFSKYFQHPSSTGSSLLKVSTPQFQPVNGMKAKGKVQRRCPDCYLVWRQGRLFNLCKTKPRHNQMQKVPKEKETWIITFASRKPVRDW
ncbi:UNVERIFIED_CONTAM: hypothetical protein RMT77_017542 [Armadillidium vulgare]